MIWLGVAIGGALGALSRWGLQLWVSHWSATFPWATVLVNIVGSLILGVLVALSASHQLSAPWRTILGTGFVGALTTFSTFTLESDLLWRQQGASLALGYIALNLLGGWLGMYLGRYVLVHS